MDAAHDQRRVELHRGTTGDVVGDRIADRQHFRTRHVAKRLKAGLVDRAVGLADVADASAQLLVMMGDGTRRHAEAAVRKHRDDVRIGADHRQAAGGAGLELCGEVLQPAVVLDPGERATDPAAAAAAFGDWRTGAYDARALELLGLQSAAHLLPEIVDGTRHHGELTVAAAGATGLRAGTPVVLAPIDTVAVALALGLGGRDPDIGGAVLGATNAQMRACADLATAEAVASRITIMPLLVPGRWLGLVRQSGAANADWLIGLAEQLLVDTGLIGLPQGELRAMLERRAADAAPAALDYRPFAAEAGMRGAFDGLSRDTSFYDLLRAIWTGWVMRRATATRRWA